MKTRIVNSKSIISKSYNDCDYSILLLPSTYKGLEFAGQKAFIKMISNKRKNQNINKQTERYFLSSIKDPQLIVEAIDNRWKY